MKILTAPFVLLLSLVAGTMSILTLISAVCGLFACTIGKYLASGIRVLIVATLISPFGLPTLD